MVEGEGQRPGTVTRQPSVVLISTIPEGSNGLMEEVGVVSNNLYHLLVSVLMALSTVWVHMPWMQRLASKPSSESP